MQRQCLLGGGLLLALVPVVHFTCDDKTCVARADVAGHTNSGRGLLRALGLWLLCARMVQSPVPGPGMQRAPVVSAPGMQMY